MKYKPGHIFGVLYNTKTNEISKTYNSYNKAESIRQQLLSNGSITNNVVTKGVKLEFT